MVIFNAATSAALGACLAAVSASWILCFISAVFVA
jgi:hypothetical protein